MNNQILEIPEMVMSPKSIPRMTQWIRKNRKRYNTYKQCYNAKIKLKVLRHYGGKIHRCKRCGICDVRFLVLDHINGGGQKDRELHGRGSTFYTWMIRNNFPEGFQVLCSHCNLRKNRRTNYE